MESDILIEEIKKKKEFAELPDSVIERILNLKKIKYLDSQSKVKEARAILRKYFTVFLTNKIVGGKICAEEILKKHISSRERDYKTLYARILGDEDVIFDFGAGVNGFSCGYFSEKRYIAIEGAKVLVNLMNQHFKGCDCNASAVWGDLFSLDFIIDVIKKEKGRKSAWMFNIIDALELEPNFSKEFIFAVSEHVEKIVISWPTRTLQRQKQFTAKRFWIINFIEDNFKVLDDFESDGERFFIFSKR